MGLKLRQLKQQELLHRSLFDKIFNASLGSGTTSFQRNNENIVLRHKTGDITN